MAEINPNSRLETFCDGVFAIALTLLIIDIKIPSSVEINTIHDFWLALKHLAPSIFAFILSFIVIFITWVNHHGSLKSINKSSASFIYANGFLLLTVVFIPFPTVLLGEYLLTDHASPAVILYDSTLAFQAVGWILITRSVLKHQLAKDEKSITTLRNGSTFGYFAFAFYTLCAIAAIWFPVTIALITLIIWIFWMIYGINLKHE
jgi:uncharacterized membrane protein